MAAPTTRRQDSAQLLARVGTSVQGRYRVQRLLGVGGMAAVYAAEHRNGHRVAIKFLLEHSLQDHDVHQLFAREAYLANQVQHPGAVPVLDDDVDEHGCPFLIMPLLEGETLRARWERSGKRLSVAQVAVVMADALDVLASAHAKGIVHRDIKPDNLFVTTRGETRVLDFGIARRTQTDGSASITGRTFGTPAFMPPEQAIGKRDDIGPHSDCWAVGATIFTLLSGEFVHEGDSGAALLIAAATRPARSLANPAPALPSSIIRFVDRALAPSPEQRWPSASEMRDEFVVVFEAALGKPLPDIAAQVRAEIVDEMTRGFDSSAEKTAPPFSLAGNHNVHSSASKDDQSKTPALGATPERGYATPTALAAGGEPQRHSARRPRTTTVLASLAALGIMAAIFLIGRGQQPTAIPMTRPSSSTDRSYGNELIPPSSGALRHLQAGLQSWRDASEQAAESSFAQALELDPGLAAAHLYTAMLSTWTDDIARMHHHEASIHRQQLDPRDLALLNAFAPAMALPPNLGESEQRLAAERDRFPSDWLINYELAYTRIKLGKINEAIKVLDDILRNDPSLAIAWSEKALSHGFLENQQSTRDALSQCLRVSPYATTCLGILVHLVSNQGECVEAEQHARTLMAGPSPISTFALRLAESIYVRGGPTESVRAVLEQAWQLAPPSSRDRVRAENESLFDALLGSFATLHRNLSEWSTMLANIRYETDHARLAKLQLYAAMELGDRNLTIRTANDYLAKREAFLPSTYRDAEILPLRVLYLSNELPYDDFARRREAWIARNAKNANFVNAGNYRWALSYALATKTRRDAEEALRVLPQYLPMADALNREVEVEDGIGYTYLLAGDVRSAAYYLRRGAQSCKAIEFPFEQTWANLHLGMALEQLGDTTGACDAYGIVIRRWGKEPRSVSARTARARRSALKCPDSP